MQTALLRIYRHGARVVRRGEPPACVRRGVVAVVAPRDVARVEAATAGGVSLGRVAPLHQADFLGTWVDSLPLRARGV